MTLARRRRCVIFLLPLMLGVGAVVNAENAPVLDGIPSALSRSDGGGSEAVFSDIHYTPRKIANIYTGK
jgi:hypothetical protein